jgi:hypothetical protein
VVRTVVAAFVAVAGAVSVASPASAAGAINVTPTTGLHDTDTVDITGSGWQPGVLIGYCQAVPSSAPSVNDCGNGFGTTNADANGSFSVSRQLARIIDVPSAGGLVDCAAPSAPCVLAAAEAFNIPQTLVFEQLHFAPVPPVILPGQGAVNEGDSGTTSLVVPIRLSFASAQTVNASWTTAVGGGCAADPATDYTPTGGTVTFVPNDTEEDVTIQVNGDIDVEPDECILVSLTNPTNATIVGDGRGTITNDDVPLTIVPGASSVTEGDSGTTTLQVPVTLTRPSADTVTVDWVTFVNAGSPPCQADPASDYTPTGGTVTFAPGDTAETVTLMVNGDTQVEPDECILVSFRNPTNARIGGFFGLGVGTITNDDPVTVLPGVASVGEGNGGTTTLQVPVTLSRAWPLTVTVDWVTFVHTGSPPCQADPATDYTPANGTVTFAPNQTAQTVPIAVNGDLQVEPDECILVSFRNPTNARIGGFFGLGVGTITNDDT